MINKSMLSGLKLKARKLSLYKFSLLSLASLCTTSAKALSVEAETGQASSSNFSLVITLVFIMALMLLIFLVVDKYLRLASENLSHKKQYRLIPGLSDIFPVKKDKYAGTNYVYELKNGMDLKVAGNAEKVVQDYQSNTYAIKPLDSKGIGPIPKMMVKEGDLVKAGDQIFYDRKLEGIYWSSPVSGKIKEIKRGPKRRIDEVVIEADGKNEYKSFSVGSKGSWDRAGTLSLLKDSGCWPAFVQRPYGIVADPEVTPKCIYISGFNTGPLEADANIQLAGNEEFIQTAVEVLKHLTDGPIHLGINAAKRTPRAYADLKGVEKHYFKGKHPAGNVGVQLHHVDPINKGETVWSIEPEDLITIGKLFKEGKYAPERVIPVAGPVVKNRHYYKMPLGANVTDLLKDNLEIHNVRVISGNVLTGTSIEKDGPIGRNAKVVSIIEEGDFYEMFGWLMPSYARPSISNTFPWTNMSFAEFDVNTNTHGEGRAFVVTGLYERVLPMDVLPMQLCKAIITNDFEKIEGLGIYEVLPEDLALCEFVCPSKQPIQHIINDGIDYMISQS